MTSSPFEPFARTAVRAYAQRRVRRHVALDIRGLHHLPPAGPVLLAARHYHHLYDGLILLGRLPRPVHLLVAADWARSGLTRRALELACTAARWPVVLRPDNMRRLTAAGEPRERSAFSPDEVGRYLRRALHDGAALLREGRVLAVFPEGYPNVDLRGSRKPGPGDFLPFQPGFLHLVEFAQRHGAGPVPIVPVGFDYTAYRDDGDWGEVCAGSVPTPPLYVTMALGEPVYLRSPAEREEVLEMVAERVRALSGVAGVAEAAGSGSAEAAS